MTDIENANEAVEDGGLTVVGDGEVTATEAGVELEHSDIRRTVLSLRSKANEAYWELGIVLSEVRENDYYRSWGFDTWREYIEQDVDISMRTAQAHLQLQEWFGTMTPAIQAWLRGLGFGKCKRLVGRITPENAGEWRQRIEGKTAAEIEEMLRLDKQQGEDDPGEDNEDGSSREVSRKRSFSLFTGQDEVVEQALTKAKEVGETDKDGQALALVCLDYMANTTIMDPRDMFKNLEDLMGVQIIAIRPKDKGTDEFVYGEEYLQEPQNGDEASSEGGENV